MSYGYYSPIKAIEEIQAHETVVAELKVEFANQIGRTYEEFLDDMRRLLAPAYSPDDMEMER